MNRDICNLVISYLVIPARELSATDIPAKHYIT